MPQGCDHKRACQSNELILELLRSDTDETSGMGFPLNFRQTLKLQPAFMT
jgi:hypothetical protein